MIEVNGYESYKGSDIKKWCMKSQDFISGVKEIREEYYSEGVKYKPKDWIYYYVCHNASHGYYLCRDTEKSPRKGNRGNKATKRIIPNSGNSYLGKDIREWCHWYKNDYVARKIKSEYYDSGLAPCDDIYYFIECSVKNTKFENYNNDDIHYSAESSIGYNLVRDTSKSPL